MLPGRQHPHREPAKAGAELERKDPGNLRAVALRYDDDMDAVGWQIPHSCRQHPRFIENILFQRRLKQRRTIAADLLNFLGRGQDRDLVLTGASSGLGARVAPRDHRPARSATHTL